MELLLVENVRCQKESWPLMHLLCSGMDGFGLWRLGTAGKEHTHTHTHPPPGLHQSDYKQTCLLVLLDYLRPMLTIPIHPIPQSLFNHLNRPWIDLIDLQ